MIEVESKAGIRQRLRQQRRSLTTDIVRQSSAATVGHLLDYVRSQDPGGIAVIATYAATDGEIDLAAFNQWAQGEGKTVAFPVVESGAAGGDAEPTSTIASTISLRTWPTGTAFEPGTFGIPEPVGGSPLNFTDCDLVLTPGVAFGRGGERLGRGRGYYDQALSFLAAAPRPAKPLIIGIAHDFQLLPELPADQDDIAMDAIASPSGIYWVTEE